MFEVELLRADEVAAMLKTTAPKITAAILNGTFPVGLVADATRDGEYTRTIIIKRRFEKWLAGDDLGSRLKNI